MTGIVVILTLLIFNNKLGNASRPTDSGTNLTQLQNFPDGQYFYGKIGAPNISGQDYIFFRKDKTKILGFQYKQNSDAAMCLLGKPQDELVLSVTVATPPAPGPGGGGWVYNTRSTFNILGDFPYLLEGTPPSFVIQGFQNCLNIFSPS